ncbi:MAG: phosphate/phosphite/phosphonate ABC transporter substrate-binding protein [Mesorhizobium sp.]
MSRFIAALPMYDWPEVRAEVDAQWARLRDALRRRGVDAPDALTRTNMPDGSLEPAALWRDPALLFAQTCWGPMGLGLADHVQVIGQPDYSAFEGGQGELYSSAVVMRRDETPHAGVPAPADGRAVLPPDRLRGKRFAFNGADSMSGILALTSDLEAMGEGIGIFSERIGSGGHRASIVAVAEGRADVAAIDCRSWAMAQRFELAAKELAVVGWTGRREGLPYICAQRLPPETVDALREVATEAGMLVAS